MRETALKRFDDLTEALEYATKYKSSHFSVGERICIHQERSKWLSIIITINADTYEKIKFPEYRIPENIENKVQDILNWKKIKYEHNFKQNGKN